MIYKQLIEWRYSTFKGGQGVRKSTAFRELHSQVSFGYLILTMAIDEQLMVNIKQDKNCQLHL